MIDISIIVSFIAGGVVVHVVMWLYDKKQRRKWIKWLEDIEEAESQRIVMNPRVLVRTDGADGPLSKRMQFIEAKVKGIKK